MQLTETVTIINTSGKVITNSKHIVNIFKEAKAAYQDKKAALKAERAAAARPCLRKAHTSDAREQRAGPDPYYAAEYSVAGPEHQHVRQPKTEYTHSRYYIEDEAAAERRSGTGSRRSHAPSHRTRRTTRTGSPRAASAAPSRPPAPLSERNLRALSELSATPPPSQVPRTAAVAYRAPYAETTTMTMTMTMKLRDNNNIIVNNNNNNNYYYYYNMARHSSRPALVHANTAPLLDRAMSELSLGRMAKPKKEIDMNLAYGNVPPDLAWRTDLGPVTLAEEEDARWRAEMKKEEDARKLMSRIDALLDEAQCVQHTATSIIDHLQQKPEAAAAVALMLAELSTLLRTMSPGFLGIIKGGSPAIFALLASPQFLIGVGVAVGVTVIFFGGWKIVKRIKEAKAITAEMESNAQAFERQQQSQMPDGQSTFQAGASYGPPGPASYDDALVLDEVDEELSTIETWRRGITPSGDDEESVDLELITPHAARSVRGDVTSIRTTRTHRSSKSHGSRRSHRHDAEDVEVSTRASSRAQTSRVGGSAESEAGSKRSHRSSRSKTTVRTKTTHAIEDGSREEGNAVEALLRPKERRSTMLKALFKKKKDREEGRTSVMA